jgi:hypothetical protein
VSPAMTGSFVNGVWSGDLTPSAAGLNIAVLATTGTTPGVSNTIAVQSPPPVDTDSDGLPDAWETAHGIDPASTSGDNGALGDPDGDGLANLLEYATGLSPRDPDHPPLSVSVAPHPTTGARHLVVTYRRLSTPGTLAIMLTTSENLHDWTAPALAPDQLSVDPNADGVSETVTVRINPALDAVPRFVRLEVTAP